MMLKLNKNNCANVPQTPGVYKLFNKAGRLIYAGRSQRLRHRISSWYQKDKSRPAWKQRLAQQAYYFLFTKTNGKKESMTKEKQQVRKYKPHFNNYLK